MESWFNFGDKKPDARFFSIKEITENLNVTRDYIYWVARKLGLKAYIRLVDKKRQAFYSYVDYRQIELFITNTYNRKKGVKEVVMDNSEELEDQHSLVTDKRFLKTDFFPDIKPFKISDLDLM